MRRARTLLVGSMFAIALAGIGASNAGAAVPGILNTGVGCAGQTSWLTSCATGGQTENGANRTFITTWVSHDLDKTFESLLTDDDWDGTTFNSTDVRGVTDQRPNIAGGYPRSRTNLNFTHGTSNTGMGITTRRTDNRVLRIRARDSGPQDSGTSNSTIKFTGNAGQSAIEDYPYIFSQGQTATTTTPGGNVTFTFTGDDPDSGGGENFTGVRYRKRNIATGAIVGTTTAPCYPSNQWDNQQKSLQVNFPDRGAWVLEAELLTDSSGTCGGNDNSGYWWYLGQVDVNSSAAPSLTLDSATTTQSGIVRPQWQQDWTVRSQGLLDPDDADGGGSQILEWDLDLNTTNGVSGYEATNYAGWQAKLSVGDTSGTDATVRNVDSSPQSPGLYAVRARVTDNGAGDAADTIRKTRTDTIQYRVDAAPTANAQSVSTDTNTNLPITLTGSDPDSDALTYSIQSGPSNGGLTGSGASRTYIPTAGFAGTDSFVSQVDDGFGRTATATVTIAVFPNTTITTPPADPSNQASGTIPFTSNATGATFECALDTPTFTPCTNPYPYSSLGDGSHTFQVRATAGGRTDASPASTTWTIDATPPDTQIDPPTPADPTNQTSAAFHFSAPGEPTATFQCRLDGDLPAGTGWQTCTDPKNYTGLTNGSHTFEVRALDALLNTDLSPASFTWVVDTIAPNVTIDPPTPPDPSNSADATLNFSADEAGAFSCEIDNAGAEPCGTGTSGSKSYTGLADGSRTFKVTSTDTAGNTSTVASFTWVIDTQAPTVTLNTFPNSFTNQNTASFTYTGSEPGVTFQCKLDTGGYQPCDTQPQTYSGLGDGQHDFYVKATDAAANEGPETQYTWTIDQTPPETTITPPTPPNPSNSTMASFTYGSSETNSTFECKLDTGPFQACNTQPKTYASLGQGSHTFQVQATDPAGNTDATPASYTWVIDTTPPATAIDDNTAPGFGNTNHRTTSSDADFDFFSNDPNATFECRLDSTLEADFDPCSPIESYTGLTDGPHKFEVRATDLAGNTDPSPAVWNWEIYSGLPDTTIDDMPQNPSSSASAHFEFSASIPDSTFECTIDGSAPAPCDSPEEYTGLGEGSHTFTVVATDEFGRPDPSPATYTWTIDLTDPDTSITAQPDDPTNIDDASFQFTSNEPGSTFECRLDGDLPGGTGWVPCGDPVLQQDYTDLDDDEHTFEVRATDAAGNLDDTPASYTWTIDTDAPETTIDQMPGDPSNVIDPSFEFSSDEDPGATFQCKLDTPAGAGTYQPCSDPKQYMNLVQGSHMFSVFATDAAGNDDPTPATYTWTVDLTAPETTIDPPTPDDPTNDTTAEFNFSSEPNATFECRLDSTDPGDFAPCSSGDTFTVAEGDHTFEVRASDEAGNVDQTPDSFSWSVDTTDPVTTITAGPDDPTNQTGAAFTFGADSSPVTFECRLDSTDPGDWASCVSGQSYSSLGPGSHTFEVRATDEAGNVEDPAVAYIWEIDTDEPETTIDPASEPADPTNLTTAAFTYTSDESPASFECRIDSSMESDFQPCNTQPQNYTGLTPGSHTFEVRATDEAGNTDSTPDSHTWVIDTTAPETTINAPTPDDPTNDDDPSFNFSSEVGATFECRLDGDAPSGTGWQSCNSPQPYTDLDPGTHTFEVRATDTATNTDPTPASFTWAIDQDEPETTITDGPADPTNSQTATFEFNSDESNSTFECSIDGGSFDPCSTGQSYPGLGEGSHTFAVQATDQAGNTDSTPDEYEWEVDLTAPDATIDSGPADPTNLQSATFQFSSTETGATFECRLDSTDPGDFVPCSTGETYNGLDEGSHTFEVRALDPAGNPGTPDSQTWEIDLTPPTVDITSGPADPTNATGASIDFNTGGNPATTECDIDGQGFSACISPKTYSGLGEGSHTVTVEVTDAAGNSATDEFTWEIDLTPPDTSITAQPPADTNQTTATFEFESVTNGAAFECRLDSTDDNDFAPCSTGETYNGLSEASHTFDVRAVDPAGNPDPSPATYTWNVDTTSPTATITGGPTGTTSQTSASFPFTTGGSPIATECELDGAAPQPCTSPQSYTSLADGPHTFTVTVMDAAGNTGSDTQNWTVDAAVPDTTITSGPPASTTATDATMAFVSSENGSTFECKLDSGPFVGCASPQPYTGLAVGNHTFEVRATDAVGNVDPTPATRAWTVTAPASGVLGAGAPIIKKRVRSLNVPEKGLFQIATIICRAQTCSVTRRDAKIKIGGKTFKPPVSVEVVAKESVDSLQKGEIAQVVVHFPPSVQQSLVNEHVGKLVVNLAASSSTGGAQAVKKIKLKAKFLKRLF